MIAIFLATIAVASEWELRAEFGAHINQAPFGIANVVARRGDLEIGWYTDTLDVRYAPSFKGGRAWIAARAEFGAAGMLLSRWEDGVRRPDLDTLAFYQGVEGGSVFYLPAGLYVGVQASARAWEFVGMPAYSGPALSPRPLLTGQGILGLYHPWVHLTVLGGTDWSDRGWSPHVRGTLHTNFPWIVRPRMSLHAGSAANVDDVTATRVGGLTPYAIPLAGAAWAEFHAEDYVAFQLGPEVGGTQRGLTWQASLTVDSVWFDHRRELGFGARGKYTHRGRFIELALGYAPWLERPGSVAMAGWVLVGADWGKGLGPRAPETP